MSDIRKNDQMSWTEEALYYALKSNDLFAQLNIVLERRFRVDKEVALAAIWQTVTNSATGCGVLVEMPKLLVPQPNSQVNHLLFGAVVFEERNINWTPGTGTLHSAEYWSQLILEFMRGWIIGQMGGLVAEPTAISPAEDWIKEDDGILCYRAAVSQKLSRPVYQRCAPPALTLAGYQVTLIPQSGTTIYYSTDGSFPGNPAAMAEDTSNSQAYTAPFTVASGTLVQWAAYQSGWFQSNVGQQVIN